MSWAEAHSEGLENLHGAPEGAPLQGSRASANLLMLLIAIDTSGRAGTVALCRGDADRFETLQLGTLEGGTYAARLMPAIAELLQHNKLDKRDVDAFVVVSGPGSFTGLRIGLAAVKGLCEALGKPLATVSMLEALRDHACARRRGDRDTQCRPWRNLCRRVSRCRGTRRAASRIYCEGAGFSWRSRNVADLGRILGERIACRRSKHFSG